MVQQGFFSWPNRFLKAQKKKTQKYPLLVPIPLEEHKQPLNAYIFALESVVGTGLLHAVLELLLKLDERSCWPLLPPASPIVEKHQSHEEAEAWGSESVFLIKEVWEGNGWEKFSSDNLQAKSWRVKEDISGYLSHEGKHINTKKTPDFSVFFLIWALPKYPEEKVVRPRFIVPLSLFDFVKRNSTGT